MQPRLLRSPARLAGTSLLKLQSDERLVELARDGHEQAFAAIVERYSQQLERYAARLVGPTRAEDALQQAFVNAHGALIKDPEKTIELRPWLYRIVHNAALNALRSSRDEQPLGDDTDRLGLSDDAIERREMLREALEAVAALPAQQRDAILLRELEGRSHDEIAVALGVTPGAARQQIFRARAALRAAATAVTPTPLIIRLMEMASSSGSGSADAVTAAGGGVTALLAKAGAGVLVTGAVAGGAVGSGVVDVPGTHHQAATAAEAETHVASKSSSDAEMLAGANALLAEHRAGNDAHAGSSSSSSHGQKTRRRRHGHGEHGSHGGSSGSGASSSSGSHGSSSTNSSSITAAGGGVETVHRQSRGAADNGGSSGRHGSNSGSGRHGSGSGSGSGGRHGSHHSGSGSGKGGESGGSHSSTEAEAPHAEAEAPGDVSGKPTSAGVGGKPATSPTTTAPVGPPAATTPAAPAPAPAAGGGGGGGGGGGARSGGGGAN